MKPTIILLFFNVVAMAQAPAPDSLQRVNDPIEYLYQWIMDESIEMDADETVSQDFSEEGYEELMEQYLFFRENPLNINGEDIVRLEEIGLLTAFQVEAIRQYRRDFGDLMFPEELLALEGFTETLTAVIAPLVYFGKSEKVMEMERPSAGTMLSRGRHQVTMNYAEKFGKALDEDYLGSPRKLQLKYAYHYKQKLRLGVAMEKDAGEPFFLGRLDDTLQEAVRQYRKPGFDFYGAHLYASGIRLQRKERWGLCEPLIVKDLALGDYQLSFGQGLTLWSGMSLGKASGGSSPMKRGAGIRPKASSGEGKFFRGAAITMKYRDFYATAFYSTRAVDATVSLADTLDEPELVSALQESGYHRSLNELSKRNAVRQQVFGGRVSYEGARLEIGYTLCHLRLGTPLELKPSKYNQYYFQGDRLTDMGLDFRWMMGKAVAFGELSRSDNGAFAGLTGVTVKPTGYIDFSVLYRNYDKRYQSLFNSAFGESSRRQGEEGWYLALHAAPAPRWDLLAYCDFFRLTWLGSQVYNPSWGQEYSLKISHDISKSATLQLRFKAKTKMKNSTDAEVFSHYPIFYTKRSLNLQLSYAITEALVFSDKASYTHYLNDDGADSRGYFLCHDVMYKPEGKPYSLTFRYALFDSDDYYSRISVYENDVLGAFSIPSLSGLGTRVYLLGKLKLFGSLSLYARVGGAFQSESSPIDLKIEIIWKS